MDFILTGLPRSGTTWASVWLMDGALCLHDPLVTMTLDELSAKNYRRRWGVADTGLWLYPDFLKAAGCPVVLLDRNIDAVNISLTSIGFAPLPKEHVTKFDLLDFPRFENADMFEDEDVAYEMWSLLRPDKDFDAERWRVLREIRIEVDMPTELQKFKARWQPHSANGRSA